MDDLWIEPKMIDFGNNEMDKAQKSLDDKSEEIYKKDNNISGKNRKS